MTAAAFTASRREASVSSRDSAPFRTAGCVGADSKTHAESVTTAANAARYLGHISSSVTALKTTSKLERPLNKSRVDPKPSPCDER